MWTVKRITTFHLQNSRRLRFLYFTINKLNCHPSTTCKTDCKSIALQQKKRRKSRYHSLIGRTAPKLNTPRARKKERGIVFEGKERVLSFRIEPTIFWNHIWYSMYYILRRIPYFGKSAINNLFIYVFGELMCVFMNKLILFSFMINKIEFMEMKKKPMR